MRRYLYLLIFFNGVIGFSQNSFDVEAAKQKSLPPPMIEHDSLYREDQFYCGFTYNLIINRPDGLKQNKFSSGFTGGFLRDMPINKSRTKAIGLGLGVTYNKFFENLKIYKSDDQTQYSIIAPGINYEKNKFDEILIDVPLEYRWRTSTPESHKFWRIYSGFKFSYMIAAKSRYVDEDEDIRVSQSQDFNRFQMGAFLAWGYNTWNFYGYYGLTSLFKSARVNDQAINVHALNVGLVFYIL